MTRKSQRRECVAENWSLKIDIVTVTKTYHDKINGLDIVTVICNENKCKQRHILHIQILHIAEIAVAP